MRITIPAKTGSLLSV